MQIGTKCKNWLLSCSKNNPILYKITRMEGKKSHRWYFYQNCWANLYILKLKKTREVSKLEKTDFKNLVQKNFACGAGGCTLRFLAVLGENYSGCRKAPWKRARVPRPKKGWEPLLYVTIKKTMFRNLVSFVCISLFCFQTRFGLIEYISA